jgi:hypothetical protein
MISRFIFDRLMSCPNCNLVLNCDGSPRCFSSQELQDGKHPFHCNWEENSITTLVSTDGVLLEVRNRKERYRAWNLVAMTSHIQTLSMLFVQYSTDMSITVFIPSSGYTTQLCLCVSHIGQTHSLLLVVTKLYPSVIPMYRLFRYLILSI